MKNIPSISSISIFVVWLFHVSGVIGIMCGAADWFVQLTPLNLAVCFAVILFNIKSMKPRDLGVLMIPFILGFFAEFLGVNYGYIFGNYRYGQNLGYQWRGVPLIIGINWVVLVYATAGISKQFTKNRILSSLLASFLMVFLDFFMETSAPYFDFWQFEKNEVPLQNYVGWFSVSFLSHLIFQQLFQKENRLLSWNLYLVFLFFFAIFYFVHL
ncbi:MAG: carotenoid biosynthesis protein [Bacteroidetes bacterium]|nr:carotenoid biosynthesis protein [Bacteroidota bacterium]MBP6314911.1 carotenoid biosynthesis protein [Chitinophagaceae bacterium]